MSVFLEVLVNNEGQWQPQRCLAKAYTDTSFLSRFYMYLLI